MPVLDVGVLLTWQYPASVVHEHTWTAESAETFGQLTDLLFLGHLDSDMEAPPREASSDDHSQARCASRHDCHPRCHIAQSTSPSARSSPTLPI